MIDDERPKFLMSISKMVIKTSLKILRSIWFRSINAKKRKFQAYNTEDVAIHLFDL